MKRLSIVVACLVLAGCAGGSTASQSVPKVAPAGLGRLSFSIHVPASTTASVARHPSYVSPATQSVSFQLGSGTAQIVPLVPGSAACPASASGYTCTATASVPAGSGQLTVITYASQNGTGAALSENTIAVTVIADQLNPINVTLNGVAASFGVAASPTSVTEGTPGTISVTWTAIDASGNTIVGPGSPVNASGNAVAPVLSASDPTDFTVAAPTADGWTVNYDGAVTTSPVAFTVSSTGVVAGQGAVAVNAIAQRLFVANAGPTDSVSVYDAPYTGTPTVITNGIGSFQAPFYIAADASFDVFVPNNSLNDVAIYTPPYTGAPSATIAVSDPRDVVVDAHGNLFVSSGTEVQEFAPPYTGAATATITSGINSPVTIALDGSDDLFVQNDGNDTVSVYAPPYTGSPSVLTPPGCPPTPCFEQVGGGMAAIPGTSEVVFTNDAYATTGYTSPYVSSNPAFTIPTSVSDYGSWGIAIDPSGDIFIAYTATSTVAEYKPPYTAAAVTITSANGVDEPRGLSLDRSGNLFVSNLNSTVTEYAPPYTGAPVTIHTVSTGGTYPYSTALSP